MKPVKRALIIVTCLSIAYVTAQAQQLEIKTHTLKNGMKIIVEEDRSIPNVSLYIFYRIGSRNDQLWATAFTAHPYQWPVVGWMVDIENWKMDDLKRHFEMGYSPSNATMSVISG